MSRLHVVAAWLGPALLVALAWRVAAGAADAPVLVVAVVAAPLVAILLDRPVAPASPLVTAASVVVTAAWLWANFVAIAAAGTRLGVARWQAVTVAAALTLFVTCWPDAERRRGMAVAGALAAAVAAVAALGAGMRAAPWTAWADVATRPALVFDERGRGVRDGVTFPRGVALEFDEAHRITALSAGVYRVIEADGEQSVVRDWPLGAGDVLALRPGDQLVVAAGARARFEAGKRVPGAAVSGPVWAHPDEAGRLRTVLEAAAMTVTLVGAAAAVVGPAARTGIAVPLALLAFSFASTAWGVYAAALVPEVAIATGAATLLDPAPLALPGVAAGVTTIVTVAALLGLAVGAAWKLREPVVLAARRHALVAWTAVVALAAAAAAWPLDPWRALAVALGVAAALRGAPAIGGRDDTAAVTIGTVVGAAAFGTLTLAPVGGPTVLAAWPAFAAAPLAWAAARGIRAVRGTGRT